MPPEAAEGSGGGLGAVVKRVCFLARRMGVNYDVAFEYGFPDLAHAQDEQDEQDERGALVAERRAAYTQPSPRSLDAAGLPIIITLYGPQGADGRAESVWRATGAALSRAARLPAHSGRGGAAWRAEWLGHRLPAREPIHLHAR